MDLQVITLSDNDFRLACQRLEKAVTAKGFRPDAVVAICSGGCYVADNMFPGAARIEVAMSRGGTKAKSGFLGSVLRALPRTLQDGLRIAEAGFMGMTRGKNAEIQPVDLDFATGPEYRRILVVDDAVDSGVSLASVVEGVRRSFPGAEIMSAVITVTTAEPIIQPDVLLYRKLIRFPWSADFKPDRDNR